MRKYKIPMFNKRSIFFCKTETCLQKKPNLFFCKKETKVFYQKKDKMQSQSKQDVIVKH